MFEEVSSWNISGRIFHCGIILFNYSQDLVFNNKSIKTSIHKNVTLKK